MSEKETDVTVEVVEKQILTVDEQSSNATTYEATQQPAVDDTADSYYLFKEQEHEEILQYIFWTTSRMSY